MFSVPKKNGIKILLLSNILYFSKGRLINKAKKCQSIDEFNEFNNDFTKKIETLHKKYCPEKEIKPNEIKLPAVVIKGNEQGTKTSNGKEEVSDEEDIHINESFNKNGLDELIKLSYLIKQKLIEVLCMQALIKN